jgi:hypothetical protein
MADDRKVGEQCLVMCLRIEHNGVVAHERARVQKHGEHRQYIDPPAHRASIQTGQLWPRFHQRTMVNQLKNRRAVVAALFVPGKSSSAALP